MYWKSNLRGSYCIWKNKLTLITGFILHTSMCSYRTYTSEMITHSLLCSTYVCTDAMHNSFMSNNEVIKGTTETSWVQHEHSTTKHNTTYDCSHIYTHKCNKNTNNIIESQNQHIFISIHCVCLCLMICWILYTLPLLGVYMCKR